MERYYKYYKYYIDYVFKHGKSPTTSQFARYFGFSRERGRQLMEKMVREGYMMKLQKGRAKFYPNIKFIDVQ